MNSGLDLSGFDEEVAKAPKQEARPTSIDISHFDEPEQGGLGQDIGDLGKSVAQGALLGGGDEVLGAIQGSLDYLTDPKVKSWLEAYRARQQAAENEYKKVQERSPVLSTVGELAGGLALPGGEIMSLGKGMGLAGKAALMAGSGALAGGLSSSGTIEGNPKELAKDVAIGTALGGGTEIGLNALKGAKPLIDKAASPVTNWAKNYIEDSPKLRQILKSYTEGTEGRGFGGNKNRERMQKELGSNASQLGSDLNRMEDYVSGKYGDVLENAAPVKINNSADLSSFDRMKSILENMKNRTGATDETALDTLNHILTGEPIDPQKLKDLQKYARDNAFRLNQGETADQLMDAAKTANNLLKNNVEGYKAVNELYGPAQDVRTGFVKNISPEEKVINPITGEEETHRILAPGSGVIRPDQKTMVAAEEAIKKSELPFGMGEKQSNQLRLLREGLENLQAKDPEALKAMGIDNIDDYFKNIRNQSDIQSINKLIESGGQLNKDTFNIFGSGYGATLKGSNIAGGVTGWMGRNLYSMPKEHLTGIALQLQGNPATAHLGRALQNVNSESAKNAVLFSIMQSPDARKQLGSIMGMPSEDQK